MGTNERLIKSFRFTYYYLAAQSVVGNNWIISHIPKLYSTAGFAGEPLGKPPLSYYIPAIFYVIGAYTMFTPIFGTGILIITYFLAKKIFNTWTAVLAVFLTAATPLLIHFSILSYLETMSTFFIILSVYTAYVAIEKKGRKDIIIAGICFGLALLSKELALFIPFLFVVYLLYTIFTKSFDKNEFKILFIIFVIGMLVYTPWLIRNYMMFQNPVYPFFPNIFGYGGLDKVGYQIRNTQGGAPQGIFDFINPNTIEGYFSYLYILAFFGAISLIVYRTKYTMWILSALLVFLLPIVIIELRDIRYLFPIIPLVAISSAYFITKMFHESKWFRYTAILLVVVIIPFFSYLMFSEAYRIGTTLKVFNPDRAEAYSWVNHNTPQNATFIDLFTPDFVYYTGRNATFTHIVTGGDLWQFWNDTKPDFISLMKKHGINYIMVESYFYNVPVSQRAFIGWTYISEDFFNKVIQWNDTLSVVYNQDGMVIVKVTY